MVIANDQATSKTDADFAMLVRNHGFVNPSLIQNADEVTVGEIAAAADAIVEEAPAAPAAEAIVESSDVPVPMADDAMPEGTVDSEGGYEAPIRQQHHHYSAPQRRSSRGGVFSELMELERRKNAWLKRTFLGR
ncbi:MAG TPA: hypothetical protein DDZ51_07735 [Planctomycetaceae bacterium]|nr:hypothetical protein [Planctomycetaceae bacterium]